MNKNKTILTIKSLSLLKAQLVLMPETQFEKLNEKNYVDWRYMMEALLIEKDLWDIVDRTEARPAGTDNSKAVRAYVKKQQVA